MKVVILTTFELDEYVIEAIDAGASGFLGKSIGPAQLLDAIRVVAAGEALLSPKATHALMAAFTTRAPATEPVLATARAFDELTTREAQLVRLAAEGLTNAQIAEQLYLSPLTVKTHINRAMMKLGVRDRAQLVALAYQGGLLHPDHPT